MNLPQVQRILHEFEKQSNMMDMKEEIMNEVIDDVISDEKDEEETLVLEVLKKLKYNYFYILKIFYF